MSANRSNSKPNILFIMAGQMRWDAMGCSGSWVKTPNLDRIAGERVRFSQCVTTTPLCIPARVSLATGHHSYSMKLKRPLMKSRRQGMLRERAHYMGIALANLVNVINPDIIIMGGLFATGHDLLLPQVEETMRQRAFANLGRSVALRVTTFGREVGMIGAAALALDAFFYRQSAS